MKNIKLFKTALIFASLVFILSSCKMDRSGLPPSTGKTNEMLIVMNNETDWNGRIGKTVKEFFGDCLEGLPQPEPKYTMAFIPEKNFSKMFQTHHNLFIVDINKDFKEPLLETKKNLWAKPQRVVKITASDKESFFDVFDKNKEAIIELFNENERVRTNGAFLSIEDYKLRGMLVTDFDISLNIPKSFITAKKTTDFVWIRREAEKFSQGIIIYFYPYTDTVAFAPARITHIRDSVTRKYIPGPSKGSYMKTATIVPPVSKRIDFNGNFAVEMRGMWELEGDFMGGPFISYTLVDQRINRVVTLEGYVYNPGQQKRNLIRQIETILYTFKFPEPEEAEKLEQ